MSAINTPARARSAGVQKNFAAEVEAILPESARGKVLEVWFQDEARVGQKGTLTRIGAERGSHPRAPQDTRYEWAYIFGAACAERAATAALVMPRANAHAMNLHLLEIAKAVATGSHAILIVDGAGWHKPEALDVPSNITLLKLPPYSPELNSMENVRVRPAGHTCAETSSPSLSSIHTKTFSTPVARRGTSSQRTNHVSSQSPIENGRKQSLPNSVGSIAICDKPEPYFASIAAQNMALGDSG